jgi:hypothetical protein
LGKLAGCIRRHPVIVVVNHFSWGLCRRVEGKFKPTSQDTETSITSLRVPVGFILPLAQASILNEPRNNE